MSLTDAEIRNSKPSDKIQYLFDGGGLYLQLNPNGSRWWRFKYRFEGKSKLLSLGVYPDIGLKSVREKHADARKLLNNGLDPGEKRKQESAAIKERQERAKRIAKGIPLENSFQEIALEWFNKRSRTWVEHHARDVKRRLDSNIFPEIGNRPIAELEAPELLTAVQKIESRGAYDLAHRVLQVCGQVFRYGIATGKCKRDIAHDLRGALTPHILKHQPAIKPEQLPELLRAIDAYDQTGDLQTKLALQLLALTFVRTNELIGAEWTEFDLDQRVWLIPEHRMKMKSEHVVPLASQTLPILGLLKALSGNSRYVFPGRNPDKPISNNTLLFALYRMGYKGKMTGHGFRAVASTALNEMGFRADVIERQLAHCERNEVRGAYNRAQYIKERSVMMQHWADYLDGIKAGAKVLTFKAA